MSDLRKEKRQLRDEFESRLAAYLITHEVVAKAELQEAIRQQVVMGGHLATILWELGYADGGTLSRLSAELLSLPEADPNQLSDITSKILKTLPYSFVEKYRILPVARTRNTLRVASCEPWNHLMLGEAAFQAGYPVEPCFVAEVPLVRLLNQHYGIALPARFRLDHPSAKPNKKTKRRPTAEQVPWHQLPELSADIATEVSLAAAEPPTPVIHPPEVSGVVDDQEELQPLATLDEALELLEVAEDRDGVGQILVRFALSKGRRVVLFMHRRKQWSGWLGAGRGVDPDEIRRLILPAEPGTMFGLVSQTGAHFMGALAAHAVHQEFLKGLGKGKPGAVSLFPVHFRGKLVFGVYLDAGHSRDVSTDVADILVLAQKAAGALERLVEKRLRA